jgi:cell division septation protein DedD
MKVFVVNQAQLLRYALLTLAAVVLSFLLGFLSALQLATPQPSEVSGLPLSQETEQADEAEADSADSTQSSEPGSVEGSTDAATAAEAEKKSQPEVKTEQKTTQQKSEPKPAQPTAKAAQVTKKPGQAVAVKTASAKQTPPASNQRAYSIQAGMFASKTNAHSFIDKLRDKKFAAYVSEFVSSDGAVKYNVRVGHFPSREQARERLKDYQQLFSSPAYVVLAQ